MTQEEFNRDLCKFLHRATTPFHAVELMACELADAGFVQLYESSGWNIEPGGKYFLQRNGSSLVAFTAGTQSGPIEGLRMVGAHTDSPCLMVKPAPEKVTKGYFQLGVEVYGGALLNPWFDRDLSLAGRVSFESNSGHLASALIDFRRPIATIPSLAIHLDREANKKRSINSQTDIPPILCQLDAGEKVDFRTILKSRLLEEHPDGGSRRNHECSRQSRIVVLLDQRPREVGHYRRRSPDDRGGAIGDEPIRGRPQLRPVRRDLRHLGAG